MRAPIKIGSHLRFSFTSAYRFGKPRCESLVLRAICKRGFTFAPNRSLPAEFLMLINVSGTLPPMSWEVLITGLTLDEVAAEAIDLMRKAGCELIYPAQSRAAPTRNTPAVELARRGTLCCERWTNSMWRCWRLRKLPSRKVFAPGRRLRRDRRASCYRTGHRDCLHARSSQ